MCLLLLATAGGADDLEQEQHVFYEENIEILQRADADALAGDTGVANRALREVAEKSGKPAAFLLIANMLYKSDPATSYAWHQRAWDEFPNDPQANLEWAMEQHRRGEFAAAIPCYEKFLATNPDSQFQALLADCLVHAGHLSAAVDAWDAAAHPHQHTAIDFAICEIYGPLSPVQRRGDLLAKVRAGETARLADLILLDLYFDRDWWNAGVFEPGIDGDLKLAQEKLGADSAEFRCLAALASVARMETPSAKDVGDAFVAAGFNLAGGSTLPPNSRVARAMIEQMLQAEADTPSHLWQTLHEELWQRARAKPGDCDALHLLGLLAARAKNGEIAAVARFGWDQWQDPDFAASLAVAAMAQNDVDRARALIAAARSLAPEHAWLAKLDYQLGNESADDVSSLIGAIQAEYRELSEGLAIRDSYMLKALFARLKSRPESQAH